MGGRPSARPGSLSSSVVHLASYADFVFRRSRSYRSDTLRSSQVEDSRDGRTDPRPKLPIDPQLLQYAAGSVISLLSRLLKHALRGSPELRITVSPGQGLRAQLLSPQKHSAPVSQTLPEPPLRISCIKV